MDTTWEIIYIEERRKRRVAGTRITSLKRERDKRWHDITSVGPDAEVTNTVLRREVVFFFFFWVINFRSATT